MELYLADLVLPLLFVVGTITTPIWVTVALLFARFLFLRKENTHGRS